MPIKKLIQRDPVLRYRYILEMWKLAKVQRWAAGHPLFSRWVKLDLDVPPEDSDAIIIPIQETILGEESAVLPDQILGPIIEKAGGHMTLNRCPCRNGEGCSTYPHDFGCLFLGEAVKSVSDKIGTQTDVAGAIRHMDQALQMGLGPSTFDDTMQRLPGLSVTINENCIACGECHTVCPVSAIETIDGFSVIDQDRCKGCGLCVFICPENAPQLHMDDSTDVIEVLMNRIRSRTDIGV